MTSRDKALAFCLAVLPLHAFSEPSTAPRSDEGVPTPGYRGISLSFDSDRVGHLAPEDRVDVIVVYERPRATATKGSREKTAGTMLKNMRVLAMRPSVAKPGRSVVRLAVAPNEAQFLAAAEQAGRVWLTLRKKGDDEDHPLEFATWDKFLKSERESFSQTYPADSEVVAFPASSALKDRLRAAYPALSVPLAADEALFVRAGDRIDVLATIPGGKGTVTVLQNVLVYDNRPSMSESGKAILLLGINYKEIMYAILAWETAEVRITSRRTDEAEKLPIEPASLDKW